MVNRNCCCSNDPNASKCLFASIIRPRILCFNYMENIHNRPYCHQIEKVKNNFPRSICFKCNFPRTPHSGYEYIILNYLILKPLKYSIHFQYVRYLMNLLNNNNFNDPSSLTNIYLLNYFVLIYLLCTPIISKT